MKVYLDELYQFIVTSASKLPLALFLFAAGLVAVKLASALVRFALRASRLEMTLAELLASIIAAVLWIFLFIGTAQALGLTSVAAAIAGFLAVTSLGLGMGLQGIVADVVSGFMLATDPDFKVGYTVISGSDGTEGTVIKMDFRKVRVRDAEGIVHVLPNSDVDKKPWKVLSRPK